MARAIQPGAINQIPVAKATYIDAPISWA